MSEESTERGGFFQQPLPDWIQPPLSGGLFGQPLEPAGRPENPAQDKKLESTDPLGHNGPTWFTALAARATWIPTA